MKCGHREREREREEPLLMGFVAAAGAPRVSVFAANIFFVLFWRMVR